MLKNFGVDQNSLTLIARFIPVVRIFYRKLITKLETNK